MTAIYGVLVEELLSLGVLFCFTDLALGIIKSACFSAFLSPTLSFKHSISYKT